MALPIAFSVLLAASLTAVWLQGKKAGPPWHILAAILFCPVLATWAAYVMRGAVETPPPQAWLAVRHLRKNTRLSAADLKMPAFPMPIYESGLPDASALTGKYLYADHLPGSPVWLTDLSDTPVIPRQKNTAVMYFPAAALGSARGYVNTGSQVLICEDSQPCPDSAYPVESLVGGDSGAIAVRVPLADLNRIRAIAKPELFVSAP